MTRPKIRTCADCGAVVKIWDPDELALCDGCLSDRNAAEVAYRTGDGQAGARHIGRTRGIMDNRDPKK
jgi:transposase